MSGNTAFTVHEHFLDVRGGHEMYYKEYIPASPSKLTAVLCMPGFWRNSRDFERVAVQLAPFRRVLTPDMIGRGKSGRANDASEYRFERLIEDTWTLLNRLACDRVVAIGTALGGFMALEMATTHPERIAGIVLNDCGVETHSPAGKKMLAFADHGRHTLDEVIQKTKAQHGAFFPEFNDADWERYALQAYAKDNDGKYLRDFDENIHQETARFKTDRADFWEELRGIKHAPIALLKGELSEYIAPGVPERMVSANPGVSLVVVKGRAHVPLLDEPSALEMINKVLAQADRLS